ncbi:MAG: hypothetical protein CM1200mP2_47840 [Planctomycetaceae bacterium]|nr:MAG: hypothetical protein CM1200mP2_47840 [Planctomycetaceae bacterium]
MLDPNMRTLRETLYRHLARSPMDPLKMTEEVVAAWESLGSDSHSKRVNATWVARFAIEFYRSVLRVLAGADELRQFPKPPRSALNSQPVIRQRSTASARCSIAASMPNAIRWPT